MNLNVGLLISLYGKGCQMSELPVSKITIGPKLRKLRQNLNLNQADMAAELGISASYLNLLENNSRPITVPLLFLRTICILLNIVPNATITFRIVSW